MHGHARPVTEGTGPAQAGVLGFGLDLGARWRPTRDKGDDPMTRRKTKGAFGLAHAKASLGRLWGWLTTSGYRPELHYMRGGRLPEARLAAPALVAGAATRPRAHPHVLDSAAAAPGG